MKFQLESKVVSIVLATVFALVLGLHATAIATPITITLDDGINPVVTCADGDACDLNGAAGAVTFIGTVGAWTTNVTTGLSYPVVGSQNNMVLDLNSVNVSSSTGGTLIITASDIDYSGIILGGLAPTLFNVGGTVNSQTTSTVQFKAWVNDNNLAFGQQTLVANSGSFGAGAFAFTQTGSVSATDPFSATIQATINHAGAGQSSFNADLQSTPEPGSLFLLGSGLIGLGWLRRKRNS